jgi:hypothetical protein
MQLQSGRHDPCLVEHRQTKNAAHAALRCDAAVAIVTVSQSLVGALHLTQARIAEKRQTQAENSLRVKLPSSGNRRSSAPGDSQGECTASLYEAAK